MRKVGRNSQGRIDNLSAVVTLFFVSGVLFCRNGDRGGRHPQRWAGKDFHKVGDRLQPIESMITEHTESRPKVDDEHRDAEANKNDQGDAYADNRNHGSLSSNGE
ncbi:hypothetical protein [Nocardia sp. CA-119907]|uniref:hypothetical protein n=1 Tax=Nocardia sp. CA-119907 TaxID=3239973 RepID=UPI003D95C245